MVNLSSYYNFFLLNYCYFRLKFIIVIIIIWVFMEKSSGYYNYFLLYFIVLKVGSGFINTNNFINYYYFPHY